MLRHVVGRPESARVLRAARLALQESPEVLALKEGLARGEDALWTLRLLAEVGVAGDDERLAESLDRLLDEETTSPAILLHIVLAFGFQEDARVQHLLHAAQARLRGPASADKQADWLTLVAMALAEQPAVYRDTEIAHLLGQQLQCLSLDELPRYHQYTFPTFDQPDALILARSALRLGLVGAWLEPWIERIVAAQDEQGMWHLDGTLPTPGTIHWEEAGQPSRWVTGQALYILREFYGE